MSKLINEARKKLCMTQGELAAATGYTQAYISMLERGVEQPSTGKTLEVSDAVVRELVILLKKKSKIDPSFQLLIDEFREYMERKNRFDFKDFLK